MLVCVWSTSSQTYLFDNLIQFCTVASPNNLYHGPCFERFDPCKLCCFGSCQCLAIIIVTAVVSGSSGADDKIESHEPDDDIEALGALLASNDSIDAWSNSYESIYDRVPKHLRGTLLQDCSDCLRVSQEFHSLLYESAIRCCSCDSL